MIRERRKKRELDKVIKWKKYKKVIILKRVRGGVKRILTPADGKIDIIEFDDKKLCYVKSGMGYPVIYPIHETRFEPKAEAILMDLDGTSVHREQFWMWVIEQTTARLLVNPQFEREDADEPFISGHSVSEHLTYMIDKYAPGADLALARQYYFEIVNHEMAEIMAGAASRMHLLLRRA